MRFMLSVLRAAWAAVSPWLVRAYLFLFAIDEIVLELGQWMERKMARPVKKAVFRNGRLVKWHVDGTWKRRKKHGVHSSSAA